jgi:hypothetical protein
MMLNQIAGDQKISADEELRLAGWIEVLQDYLGEFSRYSRHDAPAKNR